MIGLLNKVNQKNSINTIFIKFLFLFIRFPFTFFLREKANTNFEHVLCFHLLSESLKYKKNPLFNIKKIPEILSLKSLKSL